MAVYSCKCLNIIVNVRSDETQPITKATLFGNDSDEVTDRFFDGKLLDVKLSMSGVETQHEFLIETRHIVDWKVTRCCICHLDAYMTHISKGMNRVVVSGNLLAGVDKMKELLSTPSFSQAYKVVIPPRSQQKKERPVMPAQFHATLSASHAKVSGLAKRFVRLQEEAMLERIRIYTENEKMKFEELQKQVDGDKELMTRLLSDNQELRLKNSIADAMSDSTNCKSRSLSKEEVDDIDTALPVIRGKRQHMPSFDSMAPPADAVNIRNSLPSRILTSQSTTTTATTTTTTAASPEGKPMSTKARRKSDSDDMPLFDLDGFRDHDSCEPFFESDDDSSVDSNSLEGSGGYHGPMYSTPGRLPSGSDRVYASSVPIRVPRWNIPGHQSDPDEDKDLERVPSPDKMAASMKALAKSVGMHDSTAMFGDLPRPRVSTMPYR